MTAETVDAYVKRALDAAERQGKGRTASDEQLEVIASIVAAHLAENANGSRPRASDPPDPLTGRITRQRQTKTETRSRRTRHDGS